MSREFMLLLPGCLAPGPPTPTLGSLFLFNVRQGPLWYPWSTHELARWEVLCQGATGSSHMCITTLGCPHPWLTPEDLSGTPSHPPCFRTVLLMVISPTAFQCSQPFPLCKHRTGCAWEKPGMWLVPRTGIAPCAFPSCSICKSACPWGGREVGKGVTGLISEPFCCWEAFPCLSPSPFPWESSV